MDKAYEICRAKNEYCLSKNEYAPCAEEISINNQEFIKTDELFSVIKIEKPSASFHNRHTKTKYIFSLIILFIMFHMILKTRHIIINVSNLSPSEYEEEDNIFEEMPFDNMKEILWDKWDNKISVVKEIPDNINLSPDLQRLFSLKDNSPNNPLEFGDIVINDNDYYFILHYTEEEECGYMISVENHAIINKSGEILYTLNRMYEEIPPIGDNGLYNMFNSFYDLDGKLILNVDNYYITGIFKNGLCAVRDKNSLYGYINIKGNLIIPCIYKNAEDFENGIAYVVDNNSQRMYITSDGNRLVSERYEFKGFFLNGLCCVLDTENGLYGYINTDGEIIIPCIYESAQNFYLDGRSNTALFVTLDNRRTIVNHDGTDLLETQYSVSDMQFQYGLCPIYDANSNCYGFVDQKGNIKIPCIYDTVEIFNDGISKVMLDDEEFYINRKGEKIEKEDSNLFDFVATPYFYILNNQEVYNYNDELLFRSNQDTIHLLNNLEFYCNDEEYYHFFRYTGN